MKSILDQLMKLRLEMLLNFCWGYILRPDKPITSGKYQK